MERGWKWRAAVVGASLLLGLVYIVPNLVPEDALPSWMPDKRLHLGLDLQGGLLLQYSVEVEKAVSDKVDRMVPELKKALEEKKSGVKVEITREGISGIVLEFEDPEDASLVDTRLLWGFPNMVKVERSPSVIYLHMPEDVIARLKDGAVDKAMETIRSRIDAFGVTEPDIRKGKEGTDIIIQLPGLDEKDFTRAKDLIGRTAQLEFHIVDDEHAAEWVEKWKDSIPKDEAGNPLVEVTYDGRVPGFKAKRKRDLADFLEGKVDPDHMVGYQEIHVEKGAGAVKVAETYWRTVYMYKAAPLTGEFISDARVAPDPQTQRPFVSLTFDSHGASIFADLTTENVKKRMAIVLDDIVNSAPVIQEPITGGRARITLGGWKSSQELYQEARDLVTVLEHGALPAPIQKEFETRVGPTLGADSVNAGKLALTIGFLLVVVFMVFYYRLSGIVADIALFLNMFFMLAVLTAFEATLTLPGIAGIVLTVGMAVDANVIIFERIREELRLGKTPRSALDAGYEKAWRAIFDANVTTFIAGIVLYNYGSGPIRGFAVTLMIGILSSMYTAIFVTRVIFDYFANRRRLERLSI